ncbi:MAG TPA: prolyl oligopeptidase family serine peptidase [Chloroflexota bacterium]|nr:prolyl oligopeptidase family serine peptidase [Chloroflexota bacterium]
MTVQQARAFPITHPLTAAEITTHFLLYLPDQYPHGTEGGWPLVLFLHGAGERGDDPWAVARHGVPKMIEEGVRFPFIAASPQCPAGGRWDSQSLSALLDYLTGHYAVDLYRIYVTGLSMGGFGTWALATDHPHRFAAIAPVCGGGDASRVCAIAHLPIWAFHGARDATVPLARSTELINTLYACNGEPRFTVYPEAEHDSWTETYENPTLYDWLLSHRRLR